MKSVRYPAPPWHLKGRGGMSVWVVPAGSVSLPEGVKPLAIANRWFLGVMCIAYGEGGMLAYNELAVGVAVRSTAGWGVHISQIWVDSPVSLAGGRELWGIPKQMASFKKSPAGFPVVKEGGRTIVEVDFRPRRPIPRKWSLQSRVIQERGGAMVVSAFKVRSHLAWGQAKWEFSGPLAFLQGRRPLVSIGLSQAELTFGL